MSALSVGGIALLVFSVVWGVRTDPQKPFAWGMYSGSAKGFLYSTVENRTIPLPLEKFHVSPDGHFLDPVELRRALCVPSPVPAFDGVIIGSKGNWRVAYDPESRRLRVAQIAHGAEIPALTCVLRKVE
ncbi:hypothetical protein [Nocardiopsis ansamitocini]|uniref:hypothetical protein n=1 Tax=Nocardiopsis ansamitocini TaxID=1670832 RepID=UPI0025527F43|nr:hypothetical protein [Nocardiopsis ansamitocini]